MHRQATTAKPRLPTQSTPSHRAPLHPFRSSSSSLNPPVVVVHKPANPVPTATYHRFRRLVHPSAPAAASVEPQASDDLVQPNSPPTSASAPHPRPPQQHESHNSHGGSPQDQYAAVEEADPALDDLKRRSIRSPPARRSAAVQTSLPSAPAKAAPRTARFADEVSFKQAAPADRCTSTGASSSSSPSGKVDSSVNGLPSPPEAALATSINGKGADRPRPRPATFPRLSTAHLSPFHRRLGTERDVYVELLSSGELFVDSRRRERTAGTAAGETYLFSGDGNEVRSLLPSEPHPQETLTDSPRSQMSVFRPSTTLSISAPLVLVHPSTTYSHSDLSVIASSPSHADSRQRRHAKAYRTAARIVAVLKARVPLVRPSLSLLLSFGPAAEPDAVPRSRSCRSTTPRRLSRSPTASRSPSTPTSSPTRARQRSAAAATAGSRPRSSARAETRSSSPSLLLPRRLLRAPPPPAHTPASLCPSPPSSRPPRPPNPPAPSSLPTSLPPRSPSLTAPPRPPRASSSSTFGRRISARSPPRAVRSTAGETGGRRRRGARAAPCRVARRRRAAAAAAAAMRSLYERSRMRWASLHLRLLGRARQARARAAADEERRRRGPCGRRTNRTRARPASGACLAWAGCCARAAVRAVRGLRLGRPRRRRRRRRRDGASCLPTGRSCGYSFGCVGGRTSRGQRARMVPRSAARQWARATTSGARSSCGGAARSASFALSQMLTHYSLEGLHADSRSSFQVPPAARRPAEEARAPPPSRSRAPRTLPPLALSTVVDMQRSQCHRV